MLQSMPFADVVDAADQLSREEKEELISILHRRLAEDGRRRVVAEVQEAGREYEAGGCKEVTVDELMREIRS